jgi:hypothetical protein
LVGAVRAQRQARRVLEPMAQEQAAFAQLREDLLSAPQPTGTLCQPFTVAALAVDHVTGAELVLTTTGAPPLHPALVTTAPEVGQAVVTWSVRVSDDGRGMAWTRSRQANLLATGSAPTPEAEVMLDHLASLTIEVLNASGSYVTAYDSTDNGSALPQAVRLRYAWLDDAGNPGPQRTLVIDLPLVVLGTSGTSS